MATIRNSLWWFLDLWRGLIYWKEDGAVDRERTIREGRITTACSGRDMNEVPKVKRRQRAADAGRYTDSG